MATFLAPYLLVVLFYTDSRAGLQTYQFPMASAAACEASMPLMRDRVWALYDGFMESNARYLKGHTEMFCLPTGVGS